MDAGIREEDRLLAFACRELNFSQSLISESNELRALVLSALTRSATVLESLAATFCDLADSRTEDGGRRSRAHAERAASGAVVAQEPRTALAADPIAHGTDRPRTPTDGAGAG